MYYRLLLVINQYNSITKSGVIDYSMIFKNYAGLNRWYFDCNCYCCSRRIINLSQLIIINMVDIISIDLTPKQNNNNKKTITPKKKNCKVIINLNSNQNMFAKCLSKRAKIILITLVRHCQVHYDWSINKIMLLFLVLHV